MSGPGRGNWETKHGGARRSGRHPEYGVWAKMHSRCRDLHSPDYANYGGRGITVCDRWIDFAVFISDMGPRPTPKHTIERIDNNSGYSPDNCRWATRKEQSQNRRPRALKGLCLRGHEMSEANVYKRPDGKRGCRTCRRMNMREYYSRQKEAGDARR